MLNSVDGNDILVSELQFTNVVCSMLLSYVWLKLIFDNDMQFWNTPISIFVKLVGKIIDDNDLQSENA